MTTSATSGTDFDPSGWTEDWENIPDTLEGRLLASQWLSDVGLAGGPPEDIAYRLTVRLAAERLASKKQYDILSAEKERYRARFLVEREFCTDLLDENADLKADYDQLKAENDANVSAFTTAQKRLDNCLSVVDDLAQGIHWESLLNGDNDELS